jgi:hypothetical protein
MKQIRLLFFLVIALSVVACAPRVDIQPAPVPYQTITLEREDFTYLLEPFQQIVADLQVTQYNRYEVYQYQGRDEEVFKRVINQFYLKNPGFCPLLTNAFFAADDGVRFMTLLGNNTGQLRGFLYDQSRRPGLTYAYFSATGNGGYQGMACKSPDQ